MATQYTLNLSFLNIAELHRQDNEAAGGEARAISSLSRHAASWYGMPKGSTQGDLQAHCQKLVRESTPSNVKRVMGALAECKGMSVKGTMSIRPVWTEGRVCGTRANVARALQGMPDAWGRFERQNRMKAGTKIVKIYIDLIGHGGLAASALSWAPVAGIVTAQLLEAAGYRCEIWGCASVLSSESGKCSTRVMLKASEAPLDIHSLSRISDPAFMRAIVYPTLLIHGKGEVHAPGYNRCVSMDVEGFEGAQHESCVALKACYSVESVRQSVEAAIAKYQ